MAKWVFGKHNWTPTATADTTNLANGTYQAVNSNNATGRIEFEEVYMAGMVNTTSPMFMMLAHDSTIGAANNTGPTAPDYIGPLDQSVLGTTLAAFSNTATTLAQRSAVTTMPRLNLAFNAFGGIVRWVAAPYERFIAYGSTATLGETSLSQFTGGTASAITSHIIFEPL